MLRRLAILAAMAVPLLPATVATAQTANSYRILSLGAPFAGIVDDYLTDVFLNPARVGELDGHLVYATHTARSISAPYPTHEVNSYSRGQIPYEWLTPGTSASAITFGYFSPLGDGWALSVGTEVYVSAAEDHSEDEYLDLYSSTIEGRSFVDLVGKAGLP